MGVPERTSEALLVLNKAEAQLACELLNKKDILMDLRSCSCQSQM